MLMCTNYKGIEELQYSLSQKKCKLMFLFKI